MKLNAPKKTIVQLFHGTDKIKVEEVEGLVFMDLELEPFKGVNYIHLRTIRRGSVIHFYEIAGYLI